MIKAGGVRRDPVTKALINSDEKEYREYQWKVDVTNQLRECKKTIEELSRRLEALEKTREDK